MKEKIKKKGFLKIIVLIVGLIILIVWLSYGTLNPCGMLKKEIWNEAKKTNNQFELLLSGDFIDMTIDSLSPAHCISDIVKIKFWYLEEALKKILRKINL